MLKYNKALNKLQKTKNNLSEDEFRLSIYFPTPNFPLQRLQQELKSFVLTSARQNKNIGEFSDVHKRIVEKINSETQDLEEIPPGLAIFAQFTTKKTKGAQKKDIFKQFTIVPLHLAPEKNFTVNKKYDLKLLRKTDKKSYSALVLNLNKDKVHAYMLANRQFDQILEEDNLFLAIEDREDEYLEKHSPSPTDKAYYSTGGNKLDQNWKENCAKFLNQIEDSLDEKMKLANLDFVVIYYSHYYTDFIENFESILKNKYFANKVYSVNKTLKSKQEIFNDSLDKIRKDL